MRTMERNRAPESMTAPESTPVDSEVVGLRRRNRLLMWLSILLAAALAAFAIWAIVDDESTTELTVEQEQMLETVDAYLDAWNEGDGEAAAALMIPSGFHDNGSRRVFASDGELATFIETADSLGFSIRSGVAEGEATFIGNYVMTEDYIPETSTIPRPSIFKMSANGELILFHYAP